jgi:CRISPR-associated protein Cst2
MAHQPISSLSISAELTIDMHALNNEGGEGNQIQTRMVEVVVRDPETGEPRVVSVNAISGDMFKHIQAAHLFHLAQGSERLPLCSGCARFNANRIAVDEEFRRFITADGKKGPNAAQVIDRMINTCVIDDLEGNLITEGNQSTPRKSVVEFGWVVGRPEVTRTGQYFHVKYNPEQRAQSDDRSSNEGQAIFYRPASSGIYALVCHLELGRIGYNDINQRYAIDPDQRAARHRALIASLLHTFVRPAGAMRSTQLPHLVDVRGVLTVSRDVMPAPTFSALNPDFVAQSEAVCGALNRGLDTPALVPHAFTGFAELSMLLAEYAETSTPFQYRAG